MGQQRVGSAIHHIRLRLRGAKVLKRYDEPQTPYQRLLAAGVLSERALAALEKRFLALNPVQLQRQIDQLLRRLWDSAERPTARGVQEVG